MLVFRQCVLFLLLCLLLTVRSTQGAQEASGPPDTEQVERALSLAAVAARNNFAEVSFSAARQALAFGHPGFSQHPVTAMLSSAGAETLSRRRLDVSLHNLVSLWQSKNFDSVQISETLEAIILPERLPGSVFRYALEPDLMSGDSGLVERSVGLLWLKSSLIAGRQQQCLQALEGHLAFQESAFDANILILQMAVETADAELQQICLRRLSEDTGLHPNPLQIAVLVQLTSSLINTGNLQLRELCLNTLSRILPAGRGQTFSEPHCLLLRATALKLAAEFLEKGHTGTPAHLISAADWYAEQSPVKDQASAQVRQLLQHHEQVARMLLLCGTPEQATARLRLIRDLQQEFSVADPMGIITDSVFALWPLPANVRFEILSSQLIRNSSIPIAVAGFQWAPTTPPEELKKRLPELPQARLYPRNDRAPLGTPEHPILMMIESAIECDRVEQLRARLTELADQGHWPAMYSLVCLLLKTGEHQEADTMLQELVRINPTGTFTTAESEALLLSEMLRLERFRDSALRRLFSGEMSARLSLSPGNTAALASAMVSSRVSGFHQASDAATATALPHLKWLSDESLSERKSTHAPQTGQIIPSMISRTGGGRGSLCFPWPISGEFEFSCTAFTAAGSGAGIGFDGLAFSAAESSRMVRIEPWGNHAPAVRSIAFLSSEKPIPLVIRATADHLLFLVDGHPVRKIPRRADQSEVPWLFLSMSGSGTAYWTDFQLNGTLRIPREVQLSETEDLRGWSSRLLQQTQPEYQTDLAERRPPGASENRPTAGGRARTDWSWDKGVVTGRRSPQAAPQSGFTESAAMLTESGLLQYQRPMQNGDTLAWEFEYQPDIVESSPALGRLLFQMHPEGIEKRWLPAHAMEQMLLSAGNPGGSHVESSALPIRTGWNKAALMVHAGKVTLTLNDQVVSVASVPPDGDTRPGIVYNRSRTEARVRNVVLSGPWPETVTNTELQALLGNPRAADGPSATAATAVDARFDVPAELPFLWTAAETVQRLETMDSTAAFSEAVSWVFPESGPILRTYAAPAPWVAATHPMPSHQSNGQLPEIIVSPALELVQRCQSPEQFAAIRALLEKRPAVTLPQKFERDAMLTLLAIHGNEADAAMRLQALTELSKNAAAAAIFPPWSALTVAQAAAGNPDLRPEALRLLTGLTFPVTETRPSRQPCSDCSQALVSLIQTLQAAEIADTAPAAVLQPPTAWIPLRLTTAAIAGRLPPPLWVESADHTIHHVSGTSADVICWPKPLTGDFTMTCTVLPVAGQYPIPGYGGLLLDGSSEGRQIHEIPPGRGAFFPENSQQPAELAAARRYRMQLRQRTLTLEIDGQIAITRHLTANAAPWLVFQACSVPGAKIRQCEVLTDTPPSAEIDIDTGRELSGWRPPWFSTDSARAALPGASRMEEWRSSEARLEGTMLSHLSGTRQQSLIQYLRPLPASARLNYTFFFEPGRRLVHPVIGDDIFELHPDSGIRRRSLSDLSGNLSVAHTEANPPTGNSGPSALPLRADDWNQMQLVAEAESLVLVLNGQTIATFPIAMNSSRVFGLFHWSDETAAEVRDLTLSAAWSQP